jgi:hypothetical protein
MSMDGNGMVDIILRTVSLLGCINIFGQEDGESMGGYLGIVR